MALVSVIIPAYNQGRYVVDAIRSVSGQTLEDVEILVVDDGSTDDTAERTLSVADPRLRYIFQENRGLSGARNTGIRHATGKYLTYLDSDDLFLPNKLELLVGALQKDSGAGIAAGEALPIDEDGQRIGRVFDQPLPKMSADLLFGNPLHVGSILLRKSWQDKVGFFDETLRSYEDWDMWLRLALAGCRSVWVPQPVSLYRFHPAQMTRLGDQMTTATFAVLDKLFNRSDLPADWVSNRDLAYSQAHLRAAAQAYHGREYELAIDHLTRAVAQNPRLLEDGASDLAKQFQSWSELPKIKEPVLFLENIYSHLPSELGVLARQKRSRIYQAAVYYAFRDFADENYSQAKYNVVQAIRNRPAALLNRGLLSILFRSVVRTKR